MSGRTWKRKNKKTWLFEVTEVYDDLCCGLLFDKSTRDSAKEWVEFKCESIQFDSPIEAGMLFWWHVDGDAGTSSFEPHEMMSRTWTQAELDKIKADAQVLFEQITKTT